MHALALRLTLSGGVLCSAESKENVDGVLSSSSDNIAFMDMLNALAGYYITKAAEDRDEKRRQALLQTANHLASRAYAKDDNYDMNWVMRGRRCCAAVLLCCRCIRVCLGCFVLVVTMVGALPLVALLESMRLCVPCSLFAFGCGASVQACTS